MLGAYTIDVFHKPFSLTISRDGQPIMGFNKRGLFNFEQLRGSKQEGDPADMWEETFRSHTDSKPRGPASISFDLSFYDVEHVYGIPERATSLALKPTKGPGLDSEPYRLFNLDVFEYTSESPFGLYGSIPYMLSHNADRTSGFFWLNAAEMLIDVLKPGWDDQSPQEGGPIESHWISESGILDTFFFLGPSPQDVMRQYSLVTGPTALPQLFSVGYHQCRWNYKDEADVAAVDENFDHYDIPCDTIWLDIEHTEGKKYMTWDKANFPNPVEMQNKIAAKGRHMVTIVDPHVKRETGYNLHEEATSKGYYVKDASGKDYDGWCWPGSSSYLDMLDPAIRSWWADKFSLANYPGSTPILYTWNDMNEPSVFNGPEVTMPRDNLHFGKVEHRDVHNANGYYFHLATAEGLKRRGGNNDRPFVLSRAVFAGSQKVGPIWTGDNSADWSHLKVSVPMVLTLGLAGMANSGADVGGFFGNPDPELLTRWYQLGAFYPFFRAHAHLDTKRREPWLFGEPYTSAIREAVRLRYSLLPYFYTLFKEASLTGVPILRPLWMEFPQNEHTFERDVDMMVGRALLMKPIVEHEAKSYSVYLPGPEDWVDYWTGASYRHGYYESLEANLQTIPVFQRAGTIIPRKDRPRRSSTQMEKDPFTLVIALNSTLEAEGVLYLDDGKTYDFEKGAFITRRFVFSQGRLRNMDGAVPGSSGKGYSSACKVERIILSGVPEQELKNSHHQRALIEGSDEQLDEETGPRLLRPGAAQGSLVVRLPNVGIAGDWSIQILR
eukprot:SM000045S16200  [mRNA]  locus=s45:243450:247942:+ [translate_table: standard]